MLQGRMDKNNGSSWLSKDLIYYAVSHDGGASWSEPLAISDDDAWADGFPSIATDGTLVHVAWQQKQGDANDVYYTHSLPFELHLGIGLKDYGRE